MAQYPVNPEYNVMDDYGQAASITTNGPTGGTSGEILLTFTATSLANAGQVVYLLSSALQRPLRWGPASGSPPYTLVTGIAPGTGLTQVPSGVGY
jgi:hypothetical protein